MSEIAQAGPINLKTWHVVVLMGVNLLGIGVTYGRLAQQIEDMNQRIVRIEDNKTITREEFDGWRRDTQANFNRLERELFDKTLDIGGK